MKKYGVNTKGTSAWQSEYVEFLFNKSNKLDAEFVVWFVPIDYDSGWNKLENMGMDEFSKIWKDTGLFDGNSNPRPSLQLWDKWLKMPKK
jgi:hypothetical protein